MGLFMSIPMAIDQYIVYPLTSNLAVIWFVSGVISFMIAGAIFAAIYKPGSATTRVAAAA
jgi:ascorbate-specific PTS system EIIC-type component UlaA